MVRRTRSPSAEGQRTAGRAGRVDTAAMPIEIDYLEGAAAASTPSLTVITYVGGPRTDRREVVREGVPPAAVYIPAERGMYRQSVRCADDEALRYVWVSDEI
jgi:hypothetical protein